ncbi:MAG TPA: hypothetical protein VH619_08860 [Verrucomicrobiae bacterium]|jgi:hypothetical protein|nr:hypothetical protein [Verrucomicrobiae bacterium]
MKLKIDKDPNRKPHARAVLKNLPKTLQAEVYEHLAGSEKMMGQGLQSTTNWLKDTKNINTNNTSLSTFRKWYGLRVRFNDTGELVKEMMEKCKKQGLIKTVEQERRVAQIFFNRLTIDKQDPELWALVENVNLDIDKSDRENQRVKMEKEEHKLTLKTKKPVKKKEITADERQLRIRQILGTE